jgi:hypothetical protein
MRILDELGEELVRAARADQGEAATRAGGDGRRTRRRRHGLPRAAALGLPAFLLLAAAAVAATLVIGRGDPIPPAPEGAVPRELRPVPGTARLNGLAVPDPDGGPAWDVRTSRSTTGATCATVGQVLDGELGIVGLDRRFRVLPAGAADTCSTPQKTGATLAGARAFRGGGALQPITVVSGVVAPGVRRAVAVAGGRRVTMALGPEGAFLAIFPGTPEQLRPRVALTGAGGQTTVLRFADSGEYLTPDPTGGSPWTLRRERRGVAPGLRCVVAQRERGPDSPHRLPPGSRMPVFAPPSVPSRCGPDGAGFVAVKRFVPQSRRSWDSFYWSLNPSRTIAWGAAPRAGSTVVARAAGVAPRRVPVDARSHGFAAVFDGHVDPRSVRITIDGRAQPAGAGVVDRRGTRLAATPVPAWRSVASVLRASAAVVEPFVADRSTAKIVRSAADPTGGPAWALRTWTARVHHRVELSPGMSREVRCHQMGLPADGGLRWPRAEGRPRTLGLTQRDSFCNDVRNLAAFAATPTVRTLIDHPGSADPRPVRVVAAGVLGAGVRSAQLLGAGAPRDLALGGDGAFLVVLGPEQAGRALRVRLVRADGAVQVSRVDGAIGSACRLSPGGSARVADPDGAAPWAAGSSRLGARHCRYVGQVVGDRLAHVDEDTATVHFEPGSFSTGPGSLMARRAAATIEVSGPGDSALRPQDAPSPAQVARRTLPGRTIITGRARVDVRSITLRTPRDVRTLQPVDGTYLAVYDGAFYGGEIVLTAHLRDGRAVTIRQPATRRF